jgi:hypothetical protein
LSELLGGTVSQNKIRSHWDDILRFVSSIRQGTVTASLEFFKNKQTWENEEARVSSTYHGSELFQPNSASGRGSPTTGQKNDWLG